MSKNIFLNKVGCYESIKITKLEKKGSELKRHPSQLPVLYKSLLILTKVASTRLGKRDRSEIAEEDLINQDTAKMKNLS